MALLQWATLAVTLDPAGESGLAHLGLLAQDETWEPPIPPPARGLSVESGQPAVSGRGRRCLGARHRGGAPIWGIGSGVAHRGGLAVPKQVDDGEPVTAGQRRGGGR
jgi:hypothetical protein